MKRHSTIALLTLAALALPVSAQPFDGADPSVRPQDDFFRYANGNWLKKTAIPGDKASFGTFTIVREQASQEVRKILEAAAKHPEENHENQLIGDFYTSLMNLPTLDKLGTTPLKSELAKIERLKNIEDVAALMGQLQQIGVDGPIGLYVGPDDKNPLINAVVWGQSGLGLPDRDYYLKAGAQAEELRKGYADYLATLHRLAGIRQPDVAARQVLALETELATLQWTRAELRDPLKTYNFTPRKAWNMLGQFPWERFAEGTGMPKGLGAIVNEPSYFKGLSDLAAKTPLETWKAYLRVRLLDAYASMLSRGFRDARFDFYSRKLNGLTTQPPRWKLAVGTVGEYVGEAVGTRYVALHFSPTAKKRTLELVDNLVGAYREGLKKLDWMTPATRKAAQAKLSKIKVKVGYPDHWRGYKGLVIEKDDAVGNIMRASRFEYARSMKEAGKPVDRSRWEMTPQTVNAYYNPVMNEIVFPAAILQAPFFDPKADDAYNYGGIGAVIGHEITHGFDDQGRHYDANGRLRDWWTPADAKAFMSRAERLTVQYGTYEPLPGEHINGKLTLGENIADLGGVTMALNAYHRSLAGKNAPTIRGLTGDQRFFLNFARVWRVKARPGSLHEQLVRDPHSPGEYRTNGSLPNVDGFYKAFGLKQGDRLYKAPSDRIRIW